MSLDLTVDGIDKDRRVVRLVLGEQALVLLNNALNEVCNGIAIDEGEFATRLGVERSRACELLDELGRVLDAIEAGSP